MTTEEIKALLQRAHQEAFGLSEYGGTYEECASIIESAWKKIENALGVESVCYGCGYFVSKCKCSEFPIPQR